MSKPEQRKFAVVENGKVVNVIIGVEEEILLANSDRFIEYTDGWNYPEGIDGGDFFPSPVVEE